MHAPDAFREFAYYFFRDIADAGATLDQLIIFAGLRLDEDKRQAIGVFLDQVMLASYPDKELETIWSDSGAEIVPGDSGIRVFLERVRDLIRRDLDALVGLDRSEFDRERDEQERVFSILYDQALRYLSEFGRDDWSGGDFWLLEDNYGPQQHKLHIYNYRMLAPAIIRGLQTLLEEHPDWAWVVVVLPHGVPDGWPEMGLIVRKHEIIDGLKRELSPEEFQSLKYEGARPGTDRD